VWCQEIDKPGETKAAEMFWVLRCSVLLCGSPEAAPEGAQGTMQGDCCET